MSTGKEYGLQPGHNFTIRKIEGGMLSYHADADVNTNPFELDTDINFIGKNALRKIKQEGIKRKQVGIVINYEPLIEPNTTFLPIFKNNKKINKITSVIYSPSLKKNIALVMIEIDYFEKDKKFDIITEDGKFDYQIVR